MHARMFRPRRSVSSVTRARCAKRAGDTDADARACVWSTDAQAVQVATLHAAKGLEYGVVLLPCAVLGGARRKRARQAACA